MHRIASRRSNNRPTMFLSAQIPASHHARFPLQTGWQIRDPAKQLTSEASSPVRPPARETSCNTADHDIPPGLLARRAKHLIAGFCAISGLVLLTTRAEMSKSTCAQNRISRAVSMRDTVSSPRAQKYFASPSLLVGGICMSSTPPRGVSRSSRTRGWMRWTRAMSLTRDVDVYGQAVWYECRRFEVPAVITASPNRNFKSKAALESVFGQRPLLSEVREMRRRNSGRTSESGRWLPDAGVKSAEIPRATVARKPGTPGRARSSRSTIAQGMPECSGDLW